jgi:tryptophan synthase alpha chain
VNATAPVAGAQRLADAFATQNKAAALMPYLMAGFPDLATSRRIGAACAEAGADILEVGVPFSDPLADGPVIHAAGAAALAQGVTTDGALALAGELASRIPVVVMSYANLVLARGAEAFVERLAAGGVSGLIVPDLPNDEARDLLAAADAAGVALVPLVAPTTSDDRLAAIAACARGFLYCVAVTGTTGERGGPGDYAGLVARVRAHTDLPIAVGFGVSTPAQAAAVAQAGADGVIVGSRLVRAAAEAEDPPAAVRELVTALAARLVPYTTLVRSRRAAR